MSTSNASGFPFGFSQEEELLYLRDFREKVLMFFHYEFTYELKQLAELVQANMKLMQFPDTTDDERREFFEEAYCVNQKLIDAIYTVMSVAHFEREPQSVLKELQSSTEIDLRAIFDRHIADARKCIQDKKLTTNLVVNIPDNLPKSYGNERMIDQSFKLLTKIVLIDRFKPEVKVNVHFDDKNIITTISWTNDLRERTAGYLKLFNTFASEQTGFAFHEDELALYLCWKMIKLQNGQLLFKIHDQATNLMTFTLPRCT